MVELDEKKINSIFISCLFDSKELINGDTSLQFTPVSSIVATSKDNCYTTKFCTKRLNEKKQIIIDFVDSLYNINEGITLEGLYYDFLGNRWCQNMETINRLLMLATACNLVSNTVISNESDKKLIIKRTRVNDNLLIVGLNSDSEIQTQSKIIMENHTKKNKSPSEKEMQITKILNQRLWIIKTGFHFLGIKVILNEKNLNQLDFFNFENELIYSKKFEDTEILIDQSTLEFIDCFKNKFTYYCNKDTNTFSYSSKANNYYYRVDITQQPREKVSEIAVEITDANSNYIIKRFKISDDTLEVELNNQSGPYGNYDDGIERSLHYKSGQLSKNDLFLFMTEDEWYEKGHLLFVSSGKVMLDGKEQVSKLSVRECRKVSTLIASHPRNRELILYTINELDKRLSGIKKYISDNFSLYSKLTNEDTYESNILVDTLVESTIHEKCNINNKSMCKIKKNDFKK